MHLSVGYVVEVCQSQPATHSPTQNWIQDNHLSSLVPLSPLSSSIFLPSLFFLLRMCVSLSFVLSMCLALFPVSFLSPGLQRMFLLFDTRFACLPQSCFSSQDLQHPEGRPSFWQRSLCARCYVTAVFLNTVSRGPGLHTAGVLSTHARYFWRQESRADRNWSRDDGLGIYAVLL